MNKRSLSKQSKSRLPYPKRHGPSWSPINHYDNCGQSCLCCRSIIEGPDGFGTCAICNIINQKK